MNSKADKMTLNRCLSALLLSAALSSPALAEMKPTLNLGGFPGLMDMPSGEAMPDGHISGTSAHFGPISRTTFSFQFSPRLSGSFRYIAVRNWNFDGFETYYDRAFDLRYNILKEGRYLPSVTVGLQDFIGTGLNSGEYIAATKTFGDRVKVTAGLGWGRLSSFGGVASFGSRPAIDFGRGGTATSRPSRASNGRSMIAGPSRPSTPLTTMTSRQERAVPLFAKAPSTLASNTNAGTCSATDSIRCMAARLVLLST
jgi:hypothetical protein